MNMRKTTATGLVCLLCQAAAFITPCLNKAPLPKATMYGVEVNENHNVDGKVPIIFRTSLFSQNENFLTATNSPKASSVVFPPSSEVSKIFLGAVFNLSFGVSIAKAVDDLEMEIAELPPPYVPILFSIALVAGVGLLTASLGDVIAEGKLSFFFLSQNLFSFLIY